MKKLIFSTLTYAVCLLSATAQTEKDLNPLYKNAPMSKLSLLLRESPQTIKKIYENKPEAKVSGTDTILVAPKTADVYSKWMVNMHWALVPVEVKADSIKPIPEVADTTLRRDVNTATFNMVRIPGDTALGQKSFLMGQTEVTQKLWIAVMYSNPSVWTEIESSWPKYDNPVENISWEDISIFIAKLNKMTGRNFRLPTAKEWQYAANGGSYHSKKHYAGADTLDAVGWNKHNYILGAGTQPAAQKQPNKYGLYDMCGNVWEWCDDHFERRQIRYALVTGGCANSLQKDCKTNHRELKTTNTKSQFIGFRLAEDE